MNEIRRICFFVNRATTVEKIDISLHKPRPLTNNYPRERVRHERRDIGQTCWSSRLDVVNLKHGSSAFGPLQPPSFSTTTTATGPITPGHKVPFAWLILSLLVDQQCINSWIKLPLRRAIHQYCSPPVLLWPPLVTLLLLIWSRGLLLLLSLLSAAPKCHLWKSLTVAHNAITWIEIVTSHHIQATHWPLVVLVRSLFLSIIVHLFT